MVCCLLNKQSVDLKVALGFHGAEEMPHVLWDRTVGPI